MFQCKHPFSRICVERDATKEIIDEFTHTTYHLYCLKCCSNISLTYAGNNITLEEYLNK